MSAPWLAAAEAKGRAAAEAALRCGLVPDTDDLRKLNPWSLRPGSGFTAARREAWNRGWSAARKEQEAIGASVAYGLFLLGQRLRRREETP